MKYLQYNHVLVIQISTSVSVRLPDDIARGLEDLARTIDRPKTHIIRKAIETYLEEYADYLIALKRRNDKDDRIVSAKEMSELLDLPDSI